MLRRPRWGGWRRRMFPTRCNEGRRSVAWRSSRVSSRGRPSSPRAPTRPTEPNQSTRTRLRTSKARCSGSRSASSSLTATSCARRPRAALRTRRRPASAAGRAARLRASGPCPARRTALGGRRAAGIGGFGMLRPGRSTPLLRRDNGLVFQRRRLWAGCKACRLRPDRLPPRKPEQTGVSARVFRRLTAECVWPHRVAHVHAARRAVRRWINWYTTERPHQALGSGSPQPYRARQLQRVA